MSYFSLIYRYEINTNILHLTFSHVELRVKCLSLEEYLMKRQMNYNICNNIMLKNAIFYQKDLASLFPGQDELKA